MLTYIQRKSRLPFGAVSQVASDNGVAPSTVTHVLKGVHRNRVLETALAKLMTPRTTVQQAFGEPGPDRIRRDEPTPQEA